MEIIIYFNKLSKQNNIFFLLKPIWHLVETKIPPKVEVKSYLYFLKPTSTYFCKLEFEN
jgi:hypothetical protein